MQYIALDLGDVLLDLDWNKFYWSFSTEVGEKVRDLLIDNCRADFCGITRMSSIFRKEFEKEGLAPHIVNQWNNIIKPNEKMMEFVKSLKPYTKIAYLSNMGFDHLEVLKINYPELIKLADVTHMSCEVGACKPTKLYYQSFLHDNPEYSGCVYLDDRQENLIAGSKYKFKSIHFDLNTFDVSKPSKLKNKLDEIRLKILDS